MKLDTLTSLVLDYFVQKEYEPTDTITDWQYIAYSTISAMKWKKGDILNGCAHLKDMIGQRICPVHPILEAMYDYVNWTELTWAVYNLYYDEAKAYFKSEGFQARGY